VSVAVIQTLSPAWIAPLANGVALLLALGFRRNRAVLILLVLALSAGCLGRLSSRRTRA
jgi:hypothetical protein